MSTLVQQFYSLEQRVSNLEKATNKRVYCWHLPQDCPSIMDQSNPVFPDYRERIAKFWNDIPSPFAKPMCVFDHNLLTKDEIESFKEDVPPIWFSRITTELINTGDIYGRKYSVSSFTFEQSLFGDYDVILSCNSGKVFIAHDNVTDSFIIAFFEDK